MLQFFDGLMVVHGLFKIEVSGQPLGTHSGMQQVNARFNTQKTFTKQ